MSAPIPSTVRDIRCNACMTVMAETEDEPVFVCSACGRDDCLFDTRVIVETFTWRGIVIEVVYDPEYFSGLTAHLSITSLAPERAPLPFTETGYRSHFLEQGIVEEAGGARAFVTAWLEAEAKTEAWRQVEQDSRQMSLF